MMDIEILMSTLGEQSFFKGLRPEQMVVLASVAEEVEYGGGVEIFEEGGHADAAYLIGLSKKTSRWSKPLQLNQMTGALGVRTTHTVHSRYGHALKKINHQTYQIDLNVLSREEEDAIALL